MAYGLIGLGNQQRDMSTGMISANAEREVKRNAFNDQLDLAEKQAQLQTVGLGAGIGGSIAAANIASSAGGLAGIYGAGGAAGVAAAMSPIAIGAIAAYALTELF